MHHLIRVRYDEIFHITANRGIIDTLRKNWPFFLLPKEPEAAIKSRYYRLMGLLRRSLDTMPEYI